MTEGSWKAIPSQLVGAGLVAVVVSSKHGFRFRFVGVERCGLAVTVGLLAAPMGIIILVDRVVILGWNWRRRD